MNLRLMRSHLLVTQVQHRPQEKILLHFPFGVLLMLREIKNQYLALYHDLFINRYQDEED